MAQLLPLRDYGCNRCMYTWNGQPYCPMCGEIYTHGHEGHAAEAFAKMTPEQIEINKRVEAGEIINAE